MKDEAVNQVRRFASALAIAALLTLFGIGSARAEKWDCSGSKKSKELISREVVRPGDRPDRELVQMVRVDVYPDGGEETVYEHDDQGGGTGHEQRQERLSDWYRTGSSECVIDLDRIRRGGRI
jgi:hypothetical protein